MVVLLRHLIEEEGSGKRRTSRGAMKEPRPQAEAAVATPTRTSCAVVLRKARRRRIGKR